MIFRLIPTCAVDPKNDHKDEGNSSGDFCSRETLHDDIIPGTDVSGKRVCNKDLPIIANDNHAEDGAGPSDGSSECIDVAPKFAPHPVALHEPVEDHRQTLSRHHHQVGDGKVHHEHVAWRP